MKNLILVMVILALTLSACGQVISTQSPINDYTSTPSVHSVEYGEALPNPTVAIPPPVQLVEWTWYVSTDNKVLYVDGLVKNTSTQHVSIVRVSVTLRDGNGKLLAAGFNDIAAGDLAPGQESVFKFAFNNRPGTQSVVVHDISWR